MTFPAEMAGHWPLSRILSITNEMKQFHHFKMFDNVERVFHIPL